MWCYMLFPKILNMSLSASVAVVFVLLGRLLLKRAPKRFSLILWAAVLFRLLCPVSISAPFSLLGAVGAPAPENGAVSYIPENIVHAATPAVDLPVPGLDTAINAALPQGQEQLTADPLEAPAAIATLVWLLGLGVMLIYSVVLLLLLRRKLVGAVRLSGRIYLADHIPTAFVVGLLRPKIYLPSALGTAEQTYILLHERTHIRRGDHIVKWISFLALSIHWFNPLVWLAFFLAAQDMEMACDEAVMAQMGPEIRRTYAASLLSLTTGRHIAGTPLAFGEGNTKGRIKNIMKYKKAAPWAIAAAIVVVLCLCAALIFNPAARSQEALQLQFPAYQGGRNAYNGYLYDTPPAVLTIELPEGWTAAAPAPEAQMESAPIFGCTLVTPVYLYDGNGTEMGFIGFYPIESSPEELSEPPAEEIWKAIYFRTRLGAHYSWNYEKPVFSGEGWETALASVYYQDEQPDIAAAEWPQHETRGILHYDLAAGMYIGVQLTEDCPLTEEARLAMAESIRLTPDDSVPLDLIQSGAGSGTDARA